MSHNLTQQQLLEKWDTLLSNTEAFGAIKTRERKLATAIMLENQTREAPKMPRMLTEAGTDSANISNDFGGVAGANASNIKGPDPVLMSMVRRSVPNLIAYDICGVQPTRTPNSLIFAIRPRYINDKAADFNTQPEAFYNEADSAFSGTGTQDGTTPAALNQAVPGPYTRGTSKSTLDGERLGSVSGDPFNEMGFTVEKVPVTVGTRALKASVTEELIQDMMSVHGIDAKAELAGYLTTEIAAEVNREVIRTVYITAVPGAQNTDLATPGFFDMDVDSDGRWSVEKFKGLMFQIEREANQIARDTRRGKGNILVCSSDVASALAMAGVLDYTPALAANNLQVDDTGNTFAGILNGRYKVYIDPYAVPSTPAEADAGHNFFVVGFKGSTAWDSGLYYVPYVAAQFYEARDPDTLQPVMAVKSRYSIVANPFAEGTTQGLGRLQANSNRYYRRVNVLSLAGSPQPEPTP